MFKKIYTTPNNYRIYEHTNLISRFIDDGYPLYVDFINNGGIPDIEIDASVADILEIVERTVQYKTDYEAILLAKAKAKAKETLYQNRIVKDNGGFDAGGFIVATDVDSRGILLNAYTGAKDNLISDEELIPWKAEGGDITLTKAQVLAIYPAVFNFIRQNYATEIQKRALVDACTTAAEVEALDLSI